MTYGWTGVCRPVFRKPPSSNYRQLPSCRHFMMNFGGKLPIFEKNLPKRDSCLEKFGPKMQQLRRPLKDEQR